MIRIITFLVFALVATGCGGGESATTFESLDSGSGGTAASSTTTTADPAAGSEAPPPTTARQESSSADAPLPDSDYPDVVVADLAGGEFHLKELAREEEPVLLWFWAPH
jgi:hypothetical protein